VWFPASPAVSRYRRLMLLPYDSRRPDWSGGCASPPWFPHRVGVFGEVKLRPGVWLRRARVVGGTPSKVPWSPLLL
jgi:hypothetical protein